MDRQKILRAHKVVVNEYEMWNSYRVVCKCGWQEKAYDENVAMGRYRVHLKSCLNKGLYEK